MVVWQSYEGEGEGGGGADAITAGQLLREPSIYRAISKKHHRSEP